MADFLTTLEQEYTATSAAIGNLYTQDNNNILPQQPAIPAPVAPTVPAQNGTSKIFLYIVAGTAIFLIMRKIK